MQVIALFVACSSASERGCEDGFDKGYAEGFALGAACRETPDELEATPCHECVFQSSEDYYESYDRCRESGRATGWRTASDEVGCFDTGV